MDADNTNDDAGAPVCSKALLDDSSRYRVWLDNGDAYEKPISQDEAADEVESEMAFTTKAVLVSRGDLTLEETLAAVDYIRKQIQMAMKSNKGSSGGPPYAGSAGCAPRPCPRASESSP